MFKKAWIIFHTLTTLSINTIIIKVSILILIILSTIDYENLLNSYSLINKELVNTISRATKYKNWWRSSYYRRCQSERKLRLNSDSPLSSYESSGEIIFFNNWCLNLSIYLFIYHFWLHLVDIHQFSSIAQSCPTLWFICPWDSPGKNTRVGCHALLQGIFPTQGSNLCLLHPCICITSAPWEAP